MERGCFMTFDPVRNADIVSSSFTSTKQLSFSGKAYRKLLRIILNIQEKRRKARNFLHINNQHLDIYAIQMNARQNGGLSDVYQWDRLAEIVEIVRIYKPESVCELGCETSSAMFAKLLKDKNRFTTVEENDYWLNRMKESAGRYSTDMTTILANRIVADRGDETTVYYDMAHSSYFDLVYVDGPYSQVSPEAKMTVKDPHNSLPDVDVELFWENGVFPRVIVIDGRRETVRRLIEK